MAAVVVDNVLRKRRGQKELRDSINALDEDEDGEDDRLKSIEKRLRPRFAQVLNSSFFAKIDADKFLDVTLEDVESVVNILGDKDGKVKLKRIGLVLLTLLNDACNDEEVDILFRSFYESDKPKDKITVTAPELLVAFTTGTDVEDFLQFRRKKRRESGDDEVKRDILKHRLFVINDRNDALVSLPVTAVYVTLFIILVDGHLRIHERQLLGTAMEEYVNGRDPRETATENIDDMTSWWEWVQLAGTEGPFGKVKNHSSTGFPHCLMASRNILVGDASIKYKLFDGTEKSTWLLQTATAQAFLAANPTSTTRFRDAARAAALNLESNGWSDSNIEKFYYRFITYNEYAKMFAETLVEVPLKDSGYTTAIIHTDAVPIEPYPWYLIPADGLFVVVIMFVFVNEARDAIAALRECECEAYFGLWNAIDWFSITLSFTFCGIWVFIVQAMSDDSLASLVDDTYTLTADVTQLSASELESIDEAVTQLRSLFNAMQWIMAANSCVTVLKFFKAFNANPRLRVITKTFILGFEDLVHYFIIFSTIFLPFTIIGHVMFGSDVEEFASITSSINTGFMVLMGEFEWYVDIAPTNLMSRLPSGMPTMLLFGWFFIYVLLVFLVLLNMLLAIIFTGYNKAVNGLEEEVDKPTIWRQLKTYFRKLRQMQKGGFMSYQSLCFPFLDDDDDNPDLMPVHPGKEVTAKSLQDAFGMTEDNANWLMKDLQDYVKLREETLLKNKSEVKKQDEVAQKQNKEKLTLLVNSVKRAGSRLDLLVSQAAGVNGVQTTNGESKSFVAVLTNLKNSANELVDMTKGVRDDQKELSKKVDKMVKHGPIQMSATDLMHQSDGEDPPEPPETSWKPVGSAGSVSRHLEPLSSLSRRSQISRSPRLPSSTSQASVAFKVTGSAQRLKKTSTDKTRQTNSSSSGDKFSEIRSHSHNRGEHVKFAMPPDPERQVSPASN